MDPDTDDPQLVYEITSGPRHGHVENKLQPGRAATSFSQGGDPGECGNRDTFTVILPACISSFLESLPAAYTHVTNLQTDF